MLSLTPADVMQVLGAKGSGMAVIAGYLLCSKTRRVVYVSGFNFVEDPFQVLRDAFLLAWCGEEGEENELLDMQDMKDLQGWSCSRGRGTLFVVDDWDEVELDASARRELRRVCRGSMLASANGRERCAYDTSDKTGGYIVSSHFDGLFTPAELETWLAYSDLPLERLTLLDYYTGGMPALTRFYSESRDGRPYRKVIQRPYTSKVQMEIVATNKGSVVAALEMVTSHDGLPIPEPLEQMKLSCFYRVEYEYRILCPYLRTVAERAIVSQGTRLESKLQLRDVQTWISEVQADIRAPSTSPARIGWNVEALFIGVLRVQGHLLAEYPFALYRTYAHGKEINLDLDDEALSGGVLLGPETFNEKAMDIVYLILVAGVITVIRVQVTVAEWKRKSHGTWTTDVLPNWIKGLIHLVLQDFWHVMPESVKLDGFPNVKVKPFSEFWPQLRFLDALKIRAI